MRKLLIILLMLISSAIQATSYYVSNTGSDAANGTSTTTAWLTINKVNISTFVAGDSILFKKGDTWREQLTISSSGNSNSYITFGSYGTGNKPRILGSKIETSWTNTSGNIWMSDNTFTDPYSLAYDAQIYFVETNGSVSWGRVKKANTGDCVAEYDWTWATNHIYIYSPTDPNTRYSGVEVTQRLKGVLLNDKQYITIDGLEIAYCGNQGIAEGWPESNLSGLIVKNCYVHHISIKSGGKAFGIECWHSNALIQNNEVHDSGRRNISLTLYGNGATVHDIIIEGNTLHDAFHTTGIDIATSGTSSTSNITIRNNYIYNTELTGAIDNVEIYGNQFVYLAPQVVDNTINNVYFYNNIFKNITGNGFNMGSTYGANNVLFYNNTFYGVSAYVSNSYSIFFLIQDGTDATFKNNIFYNNVDVTTKPTFAIWGITADAGTVICDYNLYYNTTATRFAAGWYGTNYSVSQWATYKSASGQDAHSIMGSDPLFISSSDYNLQLTSPAINAGVDVGLTTDYVGNAIVGLPDIGAYELADVTNPTVTAFIVPATSTSLTVTISTFTATDDTGVTGYLLTESATTPSPSEGLWSAIAPSNYIFTTEGAKTLYAWAKDAEGNVSSSLNDSVVITVTPPTRVAGTYHKFRYVYHKLVMMF